MPFRAGGYMQLECPPHRIDFKSFDIEAPYRDDWDKFDLWRFKSVLTEPIERAYSMANYPLREGHTAVHDPHRLPARLPHRHPARHHEFVTSST